MHYCVAEHARRRARSHPPPRSPPPTLPYVLRLANLGTREALLGDPALANGVLVSEGAVTYAALAESLHMPYVPLERALPA